MSARALLWALAQDPGSPAEKMMLIALADAADESGLVDAARDEVDAFASASRAEGRKAEARLAAKGFLLGAGAAAPVRVRWQLRLDQPIVAAPAKPRPARDLGTRLPEEWQPSEEDRAFARARGLDERTIADEAEKFRNYWLAKAGAGATKKRWDLVWRNWVITAGERKGGAAYRTPHQRPHAWTA